jgi:hypothetical protein
MRNLSETFILIVLGLKAAVAVVAAPDRTRTRYFVYIWSRISRMGQRFEKLYTQWKNGTLPKPRGPRAPRPAGTRKASPPPFRLPTGRLWMPRLIQGTNVFGSQLRHWLANDPELPAFLAAVPQAGRILRPLCHMFGIKLEAPLGPKLDHLAAIAKPPPRRARPAAAPTPAPTPAPPAKRRRPAPPTAPPVFSSP